MTSENATRDALTLIHAAVNALKQRKEDVDKLNVFPVPDGDTGTNMALTMDAVLGELEKLPEVPSLSEVCHAVTHGSLMGARGNSGVILSQILRGLCEVAAADEALGPVTIAEALERSVTVAFQAVRKPVEGTMLTVLRDTSKAARAAAESGGDTDTVLSAVVTEAFESVARGPELLPVLKENGVVDAGGFGLAILMQGFAEAWEGHDLAAPLDRLASRGTAVMSVEPANDWDDDEYLYCTEFLLFGGGLDKEKVHDFISSQGGSELVVGDPDALKVHVHTDDPSAVLAYALSLGEVAEVHVNNMRRQTAQRSHELAKDAAVAQRKEIGFVAVAAGEGLAAILTSLGVDKVVAGGQTMNPSTAELLQAADEVHAKAVIILPDNRNIIMAAQQVAELSDKPIHVVPTTSVPEAFAAMLAFDQSSPVEQAVQAMTEAAATVRTGEVTHAVKDARGKAGEIRSGQVIGISDHEVEVVGDDIAEVSARLLDVIAADGETLTLLAGADMPPDVLASIADRLSAAHPELEVETHVGGQPLYPLIMAVE